MTEHIYQIIVAVIAAGGVGTVTTYLLTKKKESRVDFQMMLDALSEDNKTLKTREDNTIQRVNNLEKKIVNLQNKILMLESAHMSLPVPMWLKDTHGTMLAINDAYTEHFAKTKEEYIGFSDVKVWGEELGNRYQKHDEYVLKTGKVFDGAEDIVVNGETLTYRIIKYPRKLGRTIVGIAGIAIPNAKI